ncbi:SagB/ThcOx family dehydrogenase [Streptomyces sp. SAS_270]|uniref:SagB/ThcOx family dehydrogenase n=1 Tax=Streptomyces sp. SAS_270 TaxID=3412748 RepID=UPI00403C7365
MRLRVSRLCVFFWRNGQLVCDDPVRHRQLALSSGARRLLHRFADWTDAESAEDTGSSLIRQLVERGVLVEEGSAEHLFEERRGPWAQWGTAATYYHLASRNLHDEKFASAAEDTAWLRESLPDRPQPSAVKEYPDAERILLPRGDDTLLTDTDLAHVLRTRRSTRRFDAGRPVTEGQLASLLRWVGGPLHEVRPEGFQPAMLKASPSPGALHAVEIYPVVLNVEGVAPGIYHYHSAAHALEALTPGAVDRERIVEWCGDQTYLGDTGVLLLYTAVLERTAWKYRTGRVYRTLFMELGHFSQTAYLVGTALGLGMLFTAATRDAAIEDALGLDWTKEILLGLNGVGIPAEDEADRQRAMLSGGPTGFSFARDAWDGRDA